MSSNFPPAGDGSDPRQPEGFGEQAPNQPGFGGPQPGYGQNPAGGAGQGTPNYGGPQQAGQQPTYGPPGSQPSAGRPDYGQQPASQPSPYGAPGQQPTGQPSPYGAPGQQPGYGQPGQPPSGPGTPYAAPGQQSGYGQPGYGQPGYGQAGGYGPTGPTGPGGSSGGRSKLPFILGGGALVLVIVVVVIVVAVVHASGQGDNAAEPPQGTSTAGSKSSTQAKPETASDAVQGYLNALAAGDATKALTYLSQQPSDTSLMTNDVLKASLKSAPLTGITVPKVTDKYAYEVDASYKLGDRPVNAKFDIDDSSGHYLIDQGYAELDLGDVSNGLPLTINGTKVSADKVYLFPGSYHVATTARYISLGSSADFLVQQPDDYPDVEPKPELTSQGQKVFKQKVTAAIQACLKSTKRNPGCGLSLAGKTDDGYTVKDGTVHRTLTADARAQIKTMKATLDYENPTVAEDEDFIAETNTSAVLTKGNESHRADLISFGGGDAFGEPEIDMSDKKLVVRWE